jgi:hypothetical protein
MPDVFQLRPLAHVADVNTASAPAARYGRMRRPASSGLGEAQLGMLQDSLDPVS